ncbi:MAG: acyltransferase, partial [Promethearchaeota archaeon]
MKKWPAWLTRQLSLPLFENFLFKILGIKTSFSNSLSEGWVDLEFIEMGKHIRIGQGSFVISSIIIKNKLIIKKVVIRDNVIIGAHAVVLPGTVIEENTILDAISMTSIDQLLERDSIYRGAPAKKSDNLFGLKNEKEFEALIFEDQIKEKYDEENLRAHVKEMTVPFHFYVITGWIIIGGSFILPCFFFFLFLFGVLTPNLLIIPFSLAKLLRFDIIMILIFTPLILIGIYLLHLFFVALFTKWFYNLADKRGPKQGIFDRNLDETSTILDYYHFRSFLFKYPIFAFIRSPFPWLLNWELRFLKSNKVGKGSVFEDTFFHSHIDFGENCYIGTLAHITNHVVDGVYGEENLTFFGAQIGSNCVFNISSGALPGLEIDNCSTILPMCATIKFDKIGKNGIYGGFPAKKLNNDSTIKLLGDNYNEE